ncbi:MAG: RluA family pseudouridine synthase [Verrucomicrobiota bacterium]
MPILYEDRSIIAIDKPAHWMLVPFTWQRTDHNLQAAITSSIAAGDFWARSRNLKFLRHVHRLDADTTGILLFARSQGGVDTFSDLFEGRRMEKTYLAVVHGAPKETQWTCRAKLAQDPQQIGRMRVDEKAGKESETHFRVLRKGASTTLIECHPVTGRTHQIRVHLKSGGHSIVGDELYGDAKADAASSWKRDMFPLALRAVSLSYVDPFTRRKVRIAAPTEEFLQCFGFADSRPAGSMCTSTS